MISHEFRAPLAGLLGVSELVLEKMSSMAGYNPLKESFYRARRRMLSILDDALLLTRVDVSGEKFGSALIPLDAALNGAIENATQFAESNHVTLTLMRSQSVYGVLGNQELLVRAFHALLETAVKFSEAGSRVELASEILPESLIVLIDTHGKTITGPAIEKFFDIFATGETNTPGGDHGLGPALACRILSLFDASVAIANRDDAGIRMVVTFRAFRGMQIPDNKVA